MRHVAVERLSDDEIRQTATTVPGLAALFEQATPSLRPLLRNIFNLHLLADLLSTGVVRADLAAIRTQPELLATYWNRRIRQEDGKHDDREHALRVVVSDMIADKSLQASRTRVIAQLKSEAIVDLERSDILRQENVGVGRANEDALLFTHHILFDYAVARLIFRRGRDADAVVRLLKDERALSLMLNPSLSLAFADAWTAGGDRRDFWNLAFKLASETSLPAVARLVAPAVAADAALEIGDLAPLANSLKGVQAEAAINFSQNLVGALFVRLRLGFSLVGANAGPWMEFAEALSQDQSDAAMFTLRPLLATVTEMVKDMTLVQVAAAGRAARGLLEFGWSRDPRTKFIIINALNAVAETFGSDPAASATLLRRALTPEHVSAYGYEELPWISRHILPIAKHDAALLVEVYERAFGYAEASQDRTGIGDSNILSLSSHKQQDYEGAWFALSETLPTILRADAATAVLAIVRAIGGYIAREHSSGQNGAHSPQTFRCDGKEFFFRDDWSHLWYRGGYRPVKDAPVLVTKLDAFLNELAGRDDAKERFDEIVAVVGTENGWAVLWASLFIAAAAHPEQFGPSLAGVACTPLAMRSDDSRVSVGHYLTAAYCTLTSRERLSIEQAMLRLSGTRGERIKQMLAGCLPLALIETPEMKVFRAALDNDGGAMANAPPITFTTSVGTFDTDAYLESEGVSTEAGPNASLREALRNVEELPAENSGAKITAEIALERIPVLLDLLTALETGSAEGADITLVEHATGVLADKTAPLTLAIAGVLQSSGIRPSLQRILRFAAQSTNPHFHQAVEEQFRSDVSWGGPSARTSAASALMFLCRFDETADAELSPLVHTLARDPVGHVRYQIIERINFLFRSEPEWVWAELEYVIGADPSESVICGALVALSHIAQENRDRAVSLANDVLSRFNAPGVVDLGRCREFATTFILDAYVWTEHSAARDFALALVTDIRNQSGYIKLFIARYSGELLAGNTLDAGDTKHGVRAKVIKLYREALDGAVAMMTALSTENDPTAFSSWPAARRAEFQDMVSVLDEIALRFHLSVGGVHDATTAPLSPEQVRLFREALPMLEKLTTAGFSQITHHLIQMLEAFIPVDPPETFRLIAHAVRTSERYGYGVESMASDLVVRIVERYLADHREVFVESNRLDDLMDCLDVFVRAGWPNAQALTFRLGEIWR